MTQYLSPLDALDPQTAEIEVCPLGDIRHTLNEMVDLADDHLLRRRRAEYPPVEFKQKLHHLFVRVSRYRGEWPRSAWPFLELLDKVAAELIRFAANYSVTAWHREKSFPSHLFTDSPIGMLESTDHFGDDCELPPPRVVHFEPIAVLDGLPNVTDETIANLYGWKNENGFPDTFRVQRCRQGLEPIPEPRILPATPDGLPMTQPSIEHVKKLAAMPAPEE